MKKIIRLTESDLVRLVKRVILEQGDVQPTLEDYFGEAKTVGEGINKVKLPEYIIKKFPEYKKYYQTNDKKIMVISDGVKFLFLVKPGLPMKEYGPHPIKDIVKYMGPHTTYGRKY